MVKTKIDLKAAIKEKLQTIKEPFKTGDIVNFARTTAPNVYVSPNRVAKYIQAADIAEFNKSKKVWNIKTQVNIKEEEIANAQKRS
ncbi:MAG: hypothetical protein KC589_07875 [Nanoarchaeota archaeon]|nr:hypothetical protein [Nanoarchaeota archaeon]